MLRNHIKRWILHQIMGKIKDPFAHKSLRWRCFVYTSYWCRCNYHKQWITKTLAMWFLEVRLTYLPNIHLPDYGDLDRKVEITVESCQNKLYLTWKCTWWFSMLLWYTKREWGQECGISQSAAGISEVCPREPIKFRFGPESLG